MVPSNATTTARQSGSGIGNRIVYQSIMSPGASQSANSPVGGSPLQNGNNGAGAAKNRQAQNSSGSDMFPWLIAAVVVAAIVNSQRN